MRSSPDMPPLQALRVFEAVGRLSSFRRAAEELLITQSAVSHQIAQIEGALGVRLFIRKARGVELTEAAARYLIRVQASFAILADATIDLRGAAARQSLRVSLLPSFAANFLAPRLARFAELHPDIDLVLDPTLHLADVAAAAADIAIRYGGGDYPEVAKRLLAPERLVVVASPGLLAKGAAIQEPADLLRHRLLATRSPMEWAVWAAANGVDLAEAAFIQLTDYNVVLQAALDGQGLAIGRLLFIKERLRLGQLVQVLPAVVTSPRAGHWLVSGRGRRFTPAMTCFADWLTAEIAASIS